MKMINECIFLLEIKDYNIDSTSFQRLFLYFIIYFVIKLL